MVVLSPSQDAAVQVKNSVHVIMSTADSASLEVETDPAALMAASVGPQGGGDEGGEVVAPPPPRRSKFLQRQDSEVARIQADMDRTRIMLADIIEQ